jgi:benzoylformate decarboxylase
VDGADWLLAALAAEGIDSLAGNPGSTELPLVDALARTGDVRYVPCLHEATAVGLADGMAQVSGRTAAVNLHVQPGLANGLSGILNAARARVPLLVTVGQQVTGLAEEAPFLGGDVVGMALPPAKLAVEPRSRDELARDLARALRAARTHPRGPVVLSLPLDVQAGPAPPPHAPVTVTDAPPPAPDRLDAVAALLAGACAPAVVAGDGIVAADAGDVLLRLAARIGAPVWGEPMGARQPVPSDEWCWRGPLPNLADRSRAALAGHDVILLAGMPWLRIFGASAGPPFPEGARVAHLDVDPAEVARARVERIGLVGDPRAGLEGLAARLGEGDAPSRARRAAVAAETARRRRIARARVAAAAVPGRIDAARLALALADAIGPRDLVVDEALTSARALRAVVSRRRPGTWLAHRGSALGWGLPAAVGAAMADRSRRVICLHGDGSALFGVEALWTAAREGVPLAVVIADNGGYEILRAGLEGLTGRAADDWPGLWLERPSLDLVAICRGYGASADRIDAPGELRGALAELWRRARRGPAVLVVGVSGASEPIGGPLAPPLPQ